MPNKVVKTEKEGEKKMKRLQDDIRKGPWTEQEDILLIDFVRFFGDRRWDFMAKVSGLNRTGKSCRLRWVNYLHPGLKRGKMTTQEEKLVLELQAKWGNRWSRIARKLPGRTDNEIKNYWRTHMRKQAQERKRAMIPSSSSSNSSSSSISIIANPSSPFPEAGEAGFYDTGGDGPVASAENIIETTQGGEKTCTVNDIWNDIGTTIEPVFDEFAEEGCSFTCLPMSSPPWQYFPDTFSMMEEEESKMFFPFENGTALFAG